MNDDWSDLVSEPLTKKTYKKWEICIWCMVVSILSYHLERFLNPHGNRNVMSWFPVVRVPGSQVPQCPCVMSIKFLTRRCDALISNDWCMCCIDMTLCHLVEHKGGSHGLIALMHSLGLDQDILEQHPSANRSLDPVASDPSGCRKVCPRRSLLNHIS